MRNISKILGAAAAALLLAAGGLQWASAQPVADFSGSWLLNQEKSELPQPRGGGRGGPRGGERRGPGGALVEKMIITQQGDEITVHSESQRGESEAVFKAGAGPQEVSTPRGPANVEAKWEAGVLVVERVQEFETPRGSMKIEQLQRWTLSEDGKTLTQEQTSQTPRGEIHSKLVYERVEE